MGIAAAVPVSLAAKTKKPSTLTTQTASTPPGGYSVTAADVSNGYASIQVMWPSSFVSTAYVAVGSFIYRSSNSGVTFCCLDGGNTMKATNTINKVVVFNMSAPNDPACSLMHAGPVCAGDVIDVNFIGIGQV